MTQFHMTVWPEHGRPTSTGSVIEMLDMITKAQMSCGNRTITVLCKSVNVYIRFSIVIILYSDGVGRTGTFICLHSQLERLKTEGVVDFFQAVKSARIQRAGLVPNAVCHTHTYSFSHSLILIISLPRTSMLTVMRFWLILSIVMIIMPISKKSCKTVLIIL